MNHLVISLIVLYAAAYCDATIFSWGSSNSNSETKESSPPSYLPVLKIREYNGIQIDPIQGSPIYLPNEPNHNLEGQSIQLSQDQLQQLDAINRLAAFLPSDDNLQTMDTRAVLPYVDLISDDSLEKFKLTVEASKPKEKTKILKLIAFLKYLKEKKLKPFKYVAGLGSSLLHKKKGWLFGSVSTTTPQPFTEYPPHPQNIAYNHNSIPHTPFFNQFPSQVPLPQVQSSVNYLPQYPAYPIRPEHRRGEPAETPAEFLNQPNSSEELLQASDVSRFPASFQFPGYFPSAEFQQSSQIAQRNPQTPYQYPVFPVPSVEPAKTEYDFKQTPAHNYASQDSHVNGQFVSPAPKPESAIHQYSSYQSQILPALPSQPAKTEYDYKQTPAHNFASQNSQVNDQYVSFNRAQTQPASSLAPKPESASQQYSYQSQILPALPSEPPKSEYVYKHTPVNSFATQDSHSVGNFVSLNPSFQHPSAQGGYKGGIIKFYTGDLTAAGSENVEKSKEQDKAENSKNDSEPLKINNAVSTTTTEISVPKSQPTTLHRIKLRAISTSSSTRRPAVDGNSQDNTIENPNL